MKNHKHDNLNQVPCRFFPIDLFYKQLLLAVKILVFCVAISLSGLACPLIVDAENVGNTVGAQRQCGKDWMYLGMIGLSTHYAARAENIESVANTFDVQKVAEQAADAGAAWFLFMVHHQQWNMLAPNATYDKILGTGVFTSQRDLPLELHKQLSKKGVKLMLYVNLRLDRISPEDEEIKKAIGGWPPNDKLIGNIAAVYREYSLRYGKKVTGWWVDSAGVQEYRNSSDRERWFKIISDALRAGNPEALVAFNPGVQVIRYTKYDDFTAGEINDLVHSPNDRFVDSAQWHAWTYLGGWWGSGGMRFSDKELGDYVSRVTSRGGTLTFDVGTSAHERETRNTPATKNPYRGYIDPRQIDQIKRVKGELQKRSHTMVVSPAGCMDQ